VDVKLHKIESNGQLNKKLNVQYSKSWGSGDYDTPPPVSGHVFKITSTRLSSNKPSLMIKNPNWWDYYVPSNNV